VPVQENITVVVMFLNPTTEAEVAGIINNLNNKKLTGVDEISDYIIKKCYPKITHALAYIRKLSLSTGYFPDQLKIAKVKPLYRKGLDTEVENYRPISLIYVFSTHTHTEEEEKKKTTTNHANKTLYHF
jgi:hypothetical protein